MEHTDKKSFSILKWIIFPLLVLGFGIGILYVSITVFQWSGSVPSFLLVFACLAISLIFVLHTSNHKNQKAKGAAFIFEAGGVVALGVTMICSIVVLRQYSGSMQTIEKQNATQLEKQKETTEQIKAASQLKSRTAQATITKSILPQAEEKSRDQLTIAKVYEKAESYLFWPLVGEVVWYLVGLLVVFGLVIFDEQSTPTQDFPTPLRYRASHNAQIPQPPFRAPRPQQQQLQYTATNQVEALTLRWQASGWRVYNQASGYVGHISHRKFDRAQPTTYDEVKELL